MRHTCGHRKEKMRMTPSLPEPPPLRERKAILGRQSAVPAPTTWSMVGNLLQTAVLTERKISRDVKFTQRMRVLLNMRPYSSLPWTQLEMSSIRRSGHGKFTNWFHQRFTTKVTQKPEGQKEKKKSSAYQDFSYFNFILQSVVHITELLHFPE